MNTVIQTTSDDGGDITSRGVGPSYPISSVDNALRLLSLFSKTKHVRIVDASRELGVARSTAHRLMQMLQHFELVVQNPDSRSYFAGPELLQMSLGIVKHLNLRGVSEDIMPRIVEAVNETVHVAELQGDRVFFINSVETLRSVRVSSRTGSKLPAHSTATGKVLLAALSHKELLVLYPDNQLSPETDKSTVSLQRFEAVLEQVRQDGFATNFGESEAEIHAVAVPIRDAGGLTRGAIAVAAPASRLSKADIPRMVDKLVPAATSIGILLPS